MPPGKRCHARGGGYQVVLAAGEVALRELTSGLVLDPLYTFIGTRMMALPEDMRGMMTPRNAWLEGNAPDDSGEQYVQPMEQPIGGAMETPMKQAPGPAKFSNFIVYVDESGDHGLETVDPNYPVFVLAFCVFHKGHYAERVVPAIERLKFRHFGHDILVLHENEIRKEKGSFRFADRKQKEGFVTELTGIIEESNFILISCVIDKARLEQPELLGGNPYHIALGFCLETLAEFLQEKRQEGLSTHVVVECRGKKEDRDLELEFRRICAGANRWGRQLPFVITFADKKTNSSGATVGGSCSEAHRPGNVASYAPEPGVRRPSTKVLL
ncbi:DUF3800 domain-containing protein [Bacillus sp. NP157]|nr:DUF3800 domain-containing protein [Bacillus sp. NP157]